MSTPDSVNTPLLSLTDIVKDFPGTRALDGVQLELHAGEVHALVGENGSGKSTTVKIISGVLSADEGSVNLSGETVHFGSPVEALRRGIATVYQEVNLVPLLTVANNLTLGIERVWPDGAPQDIVTRGRDVLQALGAEFPISTRVTNLDHPEKQFVQIARSIALDPRILLLDEPTEGLSEPQYERLQKLLLDLRSQGVGIIYVSHRLQEVMDIADRISVLRDGKRVATVAKADATRTELIKMMVGRVPVENELVSDHISQAAPVLSVRSLGRAGYFEDISLEVKAGEIVGLAGVPGSRKAELLRSICGLDPYDRGSVEIEGHPCPPGSPRAAVRMGVVFLPADRKGEGVVMPASVRSNIVLPEVESLSFFGLRRRQREAVVAQKHVDQLDIRTPGIETLVRNLSGGNQQKVLFAKIIHAGANVILLDEPTQGVDIAGNAEIHALIQDLAQQGAAILVASSEMDELIQICHRIVVIRLGRLAGEFASADADPEAILHLALP